MAEIQAGTRFAAIAPSVDVERRSALVNTTALDYTIEDIAAAVGGDVDLSAYLTIANAATTYQPLSGMASYLTTANAATIYQAISTLQASVYDALFGDGTLNNFTYSGAPFLGTVGISSYLNRKFSVRINTGTGTLPSGSVWFFNVENTYIFDDNSPVIISIQTESGYECSSFLMATGSTTRQVAIKNIGSSIPQNTKIWVFGFVIQ